MASWIPFEGPEGGPNYFEWDDKRLYDMYVDNNGDATADYTYTLSSQVEVGNPNTFLYNTGPIGSVGDADWNRKQFYTVTETAADGTGTVLVANQPTAPVNIGEKSTKDYAALEAQTFYNAPGGIKVFAGQTDDPFFVDLQVFDLLTLRGQKPPIGYQLYNIPVDSLVRLQRPQPGGRGSCQPPQAGQRTGAGRLVRHPPANAACAGRAQR